MLGFLFGLAVGSIAFSGSPHATMLAQQIIAQIPIRCIAAFEQSEADYRVCRRLAITAELISNSRLRADETAYCVYVWRNIVDKGNRLSGGDPDSKLMSWQNVCDRDQVATWELVALNALKTEFEKVKDRPRK